jgi:4-amino-4-deoxy-L-arabinose transferase-like glycosyltransferase
MADIHTTIADLTPAPEPATNEPRVAQVVIADLTPAPEPATNEPRVAQVVVEAVYEDGVIKPLVPLELPAGTPITLQIAIQATAIVTPQAVAQPMLGYPPAQQPAQAPALAVPPLAMQRAQAWLRASIKPFEQLATFTRADLLLLSFGLLIYALTRLIGLTRFPIYFFCDEAIQATLASDLLQRGFRDHLGTLLPPFFLNDKNWNLSFSIYVHLITVTLFGKSVFITRATSVLVSMLAAAAVTLTLKLVFRIRLWWTGALALAIIPAWFLHARTAFETVMMVSFYACFLCAYLLYRYYNPKYLYMALLFGGATFYSYTNGQGVMLVSGVLLLLSDLRYHLRQKPQLLGGALLLLLALVVPILRFRYLHPDAPESQLRSLASYWFQRIPLSEKLATFGQNYLQGLSPGYWFIPNEVDLERHRMKDMGQLPLLFLPFILIGLGICVRQWRSSAHRAVLIAVLAAPFSAALVGIGITRVLAMVVPATLLFCLGLDQARAWLDRRVSYMPIAIGSAALLCTLSFGLLRSALVDGPTWYADYGLGGMQYGAEQIFTTVPEELAKSPDTRMLVSPDWANNPNVFPFFFLNEQQRDRLELLNIDAFLFHKRELNLNELFVMTADEYKRAVDSQKFIVQPPERILPYPNGQPGFYFVRMQYVDNVDALFAADRQVRQQLQEHSAIMDGQPVVVRHSQLDIGQIENIFDGDDSTLMRGFEANPLVIEIDFPTPRSAGTLGVTVASMDFTLKVEATPASGDPPRSTTMTYRNMPDDPHVDLALPSGGQPISKLRIEITNINSGDTANIHVREVSLK